MSDVTRHVSHPYDKSYRAFFDFQEMVISLLEGYIPKQFLHEFNLEKIEPVPAEYVSDGLLRRGGDYVWRMP